ncbi:dTDP-glucose 4,6-dehydratase [Candidatus Peregrinibacteria bacterium]|nr:dTDP-glucose 4,6-dehydratase [Candidatus Peregrinibacteria bacterium]
MKILITGGAGFIGTNYCYYHSDKYPDDEIFVLDKLTYAGNLDNLYELIHRPHFHFVQGDIADKKFILDFFEKEYFDIVVHFAAESHVDRSIEEPDVFVVTNVIGTQNLLEAAKNTNVKRFHHISTDEVYGDLRESPDSYFTELTPLAPNSPYAASKASSDLIVRSYFHTYGMPVTISRCSNNYGPYQFPEKLIPYFFGLISENKPVPVYGDGLHVRDWLFVTDHCRAVDLIIQKGKIGEIYNIGGNNEKTNIEITKFLLKFLGKDESCIIYVDDRLGHDRRYAIDASKIQKELGFKPETSFEDGIKQTFEWYQNNREWSKKLIDKVQTRKHKQVSKTPLPAFRK